MYHTENWKELIVKIAGEYSPVNDSRDSWLLRAARNAKITHGQAGKLFYGQMTDPRWSLAIKVKNAVEKIDAIEKARREAAHLSSQYLQIVRGSINVDQNLLGATASDVLDASRLLGGVDMPGDYGINIVRK